MKSSFPIASALQAVRRATRSAVEPSVDRVARARDPFRVLAATILSLRTKDETTDAAAERLFAAADTPQAMIRLSAPRIERLIYPVGFYRTKARTLREISRALIDRHGGEVPRDLDALLALRGVGRKTANLVLTRGHGLPGICVDVHVHRITNRWGYVKTRAPDETEMRLRERLPARHWMELNSLLVAFGRTTCRPVSPWCSRCPLGATCRRIGVSRIR